MWPVQCNCCIHWHWERSFWTSLPRWRDWLLLVSVKKFSSLDVENFLTLTTMTCVTLFLGYVVCRQISNRQSTLRLALSFLRARQTCSFVSCLVTTTSCVFWEPGNHTLVCLQGVQVSRALRQRRCPIQNSSISHWPWYFHLVDESTKVRVDCWLLTSNLPQRLALLCFESQARMLFCLLPTSKEDGTTQNGYY